MLGDVKHTNRGYQYILFADYNGRDCSLQQSSMAMYEQPGSSAIWLGLESEGECSSRMHLSLETVVELVAVLQNWIATGALYQE